MKFKKISIFLILLFCIIGVSSAAEDVSTDAVDASDDAVVVDAVSEEVSDSVESTVENEPVVDESASDEETPTNVWYVDSSATGSNDGSSWENAFTNINNALSKVENDGKIYVADGVYTRKGFSRPINITLIGQGENTIFNSFESRAYGSNTLNLDAGYTFINFTFKQADVGRNTLFINCTFHDSLQLSVMKYLYTYIEVYETLEERRWVDDGYAFTYNATFDNCVFKNLNSEDALITVYKYGKAEFYNCTFENITSNSIINKIGEFVLEDGIYLYDCTFSNVNVNGIVDIPGNIEIIDYCAIENCDYDFDATTDIAMVDDYAHNYLNATKLKVVAVDSIVDISSSEKGTVTVTLTDNSTNPIAGASFKYTVNGGEEQTATTGDDGKYTITGLTGEVTIAFNYEGNESFNAISDTKSFNFTEEPVAPAKVATKITAPKVSAVYNVAKNLVITLTDKDGKALANKKVTVKVGTISKTLTTNAKGQVSLNVATLVPKTYTATVKFAGDDRYTASSASPKVVVSKAKAKITAKAKAFKVKVKTKKYTVILKNNKGKVMKKVKLTMKVGKKTYKATTNSKGKATFKITKLTKKGKYTATVKFAGNKYYKALSKKAKITVKK